MSRQFRRIASTVAVVISAVVGVPSGTRADQVTDEPDWVTAVAAPLGLGSVRADASDSTVAVAATFTGPTGQVFGEPVAGPAVVVAARNDNGTPRWAQAATGSAQQIAVAADADHIGVAATLTSPIDFGGGPIGQAPVFGLRGTAVGAYDATTGAYLWSRVVGDRYPCTVASAAFDGHLIVAGSFYLSADFGAGPVSAGNPCRLYVASYDLDDGTVEWLTVGPTTTNATEVIADASGVVVVGDSSYPTGGNGHITKLGWDGSIEWTRYVGGGPSFNTNPTQISGVDIGPTGNIYVGFTVLNGSWNFGLGPVVASAGVLTLDSATGTALDVDSFGFPSGSASVNGPQVEVTDDGRVLTIWEHRSPAIVAGVGPNAPYGGTPSVVVAEVDLLAGEVLWARPLGNQQSVNARDVFDLPGDRIGFLAGFSTNPMQGLGAPIAPSVFSGSPAPTVIMAALDIGASDTTPPQVTGTVTPQPNTAGWNNTPATVTWSAEDPTPSSGLTASPVASVVSAEGSDQVVTSEPACDAAGNCATGTVVVSIDITAPTVNLVAPANGGAVPGAVYTPPTCTATDSLSGVDGVCAVTVDVIGTQPGSITYQATAFAADLAGNTSIATSTYTVVLDADAPTVVATPDRDANTAGWYGGPVTYSFACTDPSGVASCPSPVTVASDGANQMFDVAATDVYGNTTQLTFGGVNIDSIAPDITISAPASVDAADVVAVTCTASDALSGIAYTDCQGFTVDATELNVGANEFTFVAIDAAGNTTTESVTVEFDLTAAGLGDLVVAYVAPGPGSAGVINALRAKLAAGQYQAFINQVNAQCCTPASGARLTAAEAATLISLASKLM